MYFKILEYLQTCKHFMNVKYYNPSSPRTWKLCGFLFMLTAKRTKRQMSPNQVRKPEADSGLSDGLLNNRSYLLAAKQNKREQNQKHKCVSLDWKAKGLGEKPGTKFWGKIGPNLCTIQLSQHMWLLELLLSSRTFHVMLSIPHVSPAYHPIPLAGNRAQEKDLQVRNLKSNFTRPN